MQRLVILALAAALVAVLPIWPFARQWTYGPAIAVGFLLVVNLLSFASAQVGKPGPWLWPR